VTHGDAVIAHDRLVDFVARIFAAAGNSDDDARRIAVHLASSNLAGHESHGVIRVPLYLEWQSKGVVVAGQRGRVIKDSGALVQIDGGFGYGQVVGELAAAQGIARARRHGIGLVALKHSAHLGRLGGWAEIAAAEGIASVHFLNSPGKGGIQVAPFGGRAARLAPNPMAIAVPQQGRHPLLLDITASVVPEGKVKVALNRGVELPDGAALDGAGRPTRDPRAYYGPPKGALLASGGHKGSGLCVMIDLLAGALTGGGTSDPRVEGRGNNLLSLYIDPDHLEGRDALALAARDLSDWVTSAAPLQHGGEVLAPGDYEARMRASRLRDGVPLDAETWNQLCDAARRSAITPPSL
jgi:hydroxycarboxylate dehydrogenase B